VAALADVSMSTVEKCEAANQLVAAFIILVLQLSYSAKAVIVSIMC
jgi:hypothetical protein